MLFKSFLGTLLSLCISPVFAASISFADYFPGMDSGEKWHYTGYGEFTLSLSTVEEGPYKGMTKFGNEKTGIVYGVEAGIVTWYDHNYEGLSSDMVFKREYETGKVYQVGGKPIVFLKVPELTVEAGTYKDVVAMIWLNSALLDTTPKELLGQGQLPVTDIDYYARGVGLIRYQAINPNDGSVQGEYSLLAHEPAISTEKHSLAGPELFTYKDSPFNN